MLNECQNILMHLGAFSVHSGWDGGEGDRGVALNLDIISFPTLSQANDLLGAIYSLLFLSPNFFI